MFTASVHAQQQLLQQQHAPAAPKDGHREDDIEDEFEDALMDEQYGDATAAPFVLSSVPDDPHGHLQQAATNGGGEDLEPPGLAATETLDPDSHTALQQEEVPASMSLQEQQDADLALSVALENADPEDYECPVCIMTLCEPVLTQCGHKFCRSCLVKAQFARMACPLCRAECTVGAEDLPEATALVPLLKSFDADYDSRAEQSRVRLPSLLASPTVATPSGSVPGSPPFVRC